MLHLAVDYSICQTTCHGTCSALFFKWPEWATKCYGACQKACAARCDPPVCEEWCAEVAAGCSELGLGDLICVGGCELYCAATCLVKSDFKSTVQVN